MVQNQLLILFQVPIVIELNHFSKRSQLLTHQEIFQSAQIQKMMTKQSKVVHQLLIHYQMLIAEELLMHLLKRKLSQLLIHQLHYQSAQTPKMMTKQSKELSQ